MANEPERPIEKLLRAAAKKRRDDAGAPFELHPATRRLLQGEVARQFAKAQRETHSFLSLLGQLWPRLAWSVALLAILGVAVWTLIPAPAKHKQAALLARNEPMQKAVPVKRPLPPAPAALPAVELPPVAAAPASPAVTASAEPTPPASHKLGAQSPLEPQPLGRVRAAADADTSRGERLALAGSPEPAGRQGAAGLEGAASDSSTAQPVETFADDATGARYGLAAGAASPARAPAASLPASAATRAPKESGSARTVQRFVQLAREDGTGGGVADKAKAAQAVLAAFDVEQDGRQLRITDRDGSVYTGYVQTLETYQRARSLKAEASAAAPTASARHTALEEKAQSGYDADRPGLNTYSFHVTGTNRSLKQKVVFTGNLIARTNLILLPPVATNLALGGRLVDARSDLGQPAVLPLFNSRISGKVVIGSGQALDINALPSAR
jgi:hypothetical protein